MWLLNTTEIKSNSLDFTQDESHNQSSVLKKTLETTSLEHRRSIEKKPIRKYIITEAIRMSIEPDASVKLDQIKDLVRKNT